jgi:hypothetical protein
MLATRHILTVFEDSDPLLRQVELHLQSIRTVLIDFNNIPKNSAFALVLLYLTRYFVVAALGYFIKCFKLV